MGRREEYWPPRRAASESFQGELNVRHGLRVPMRDGVHLALDLLLPAADGAHPVILTRTPYDKVLSRDNPLNRALLHSGYIVALNDCRGRFNSDGEFFPYMDERRDGFDTVEWIAAQDWCDGNVGMIGGSYGGQTQWLAAADVPPHLKAIVPTCSPPDLFDNEPVYGGALLLPMAEWMVDMGLRSYQTTTFLTDIFKEAKSYMETLPVADIPRAAGTDSAWWDEMMRHPNFDDFWRQGCYQDAWDKMKVAALNVTGWWDMNFPGAPTNFAGIQSGGVNDDVRAAQKLIIGPWPHWVNRERALNGVDFGPDALIDLERYVIRFFDHHLKGVDNGVDTERAAYVFVLGANEWWVEDTWPLPDTKYTPYYFHSGGNANTLMGDGSLSADPPGDEPVDSYSYDPADPVRFVWNLRDGPVDDRLVSLRPDMLCYTSAVLTDPLDVVGPVTCVLHATSSARDTDWHVRLVDVYPDGSAHFLTHGILRARFRESYEKPVLLEPNERYEFHIGMDAAGNRFLPGHQIRIELTSSWFPKYDRNLNSGAENNFLDANPVVAHQTIFHNSVNASHVLLPVVPAE